MYIENGKSFLLPFDQLLLLPLIITITGQVIIVTGQLHGLLTSIYLLHLPGMFRPFIVNPLLSDLCNILTVTTDDHFLTRLLNHVNPFLIFTQVIGFTSHFIYLN